METMVTWLLAAFASYLSAGVVFGVLFALIGVRRVDPAAAEGTWGFKLMIIPGAMVFWPLLLRRWMKKLPPPEERSAHRKEAGH